MPHDELLTANHESRAYSIDVRDALAELCGYPMLVKTPSHEAAGIASAGFRGDTYLFIRIRAEFPGVGR